MSRLLRHLKRSINELQGKKPTLLEKLQEKIDNSRAVRFCRNWYYSISAFFSNLPMFVKFAWGFRQWDYQYSMQIYIELLEVHGRNIRKYGNSVGKEKTARRAFTMAGMLRKAYCEHYISKTSLYLYDKNGYSFMKNYDPKTPKRILDGMRKIVNDREEIIEAALKRDAMLYWHKYIESVWD